MLCTGNGGDNVSMFASAAGCFDLNLLKSNFSLGLAIVTGGVFGATSGGVFGTTSGVVLGVGVSAFPTILIRGAMSASSMMGDCLRLRLFAGSFLLEFFNQAAFVRATKPGEREAAHDASSPPMPLVATRTRRLMMSRSLSSAP